MGREIERKFRVVGEGWRPAADAPARRIRQFYLADGDNAAVRVRVVDGRAAVLTVKGRGTALARAEFEYAIPFADAQALAELRTGRVIEKVRHRVGASGGRTWEIDVFEGELAGLTIAEIELGSQNEAFEKPDWIGAEVTGDPRFYNQALAQAVAPPL